MINFEEFWFKLQDYGLSELFFCFEKREFEASTLNKI